MVDFSIFRPAYPTDHCYLIELLYWRAFGRLPEDLWDFEKSWRFSPNIRDTPDAPFPEGPELSDSECEFAGIPEDPRMVAIADEEYNLGVDHYKMILEIVKGLDPRNPEEEAKARKNIAEAERIEEVAKNWLPFFHEYIDEFQNEICLDLRRGNIIAIATELPSTNYEETERQLESQGIWLDGLPVSKVPKSQWISNTIDWERGAIEGRDRSFIWIHFNLNDVLDLYPPQHIIDPSKTFKIGSNIAIAGASKRNTTTAGRRGRPSLPWEQFHVEVARLYAIDDMPGKKEAAIALLQEWFSRELSTTVSRSAIGARLKPYFDKIGPTGKK